MELFSYEKYPSALSLLYCTALLGILCWLQKLFTSCHFRALCSCWNYSFCFRCEKIKVTRLHPWTINSVSCRRTKRVCSPGLASGFFPPCLLLQRVTTETEAEMDQSSMFFLNQTAECQKHLWGFRERFLVFCLSVALEVLTGSELFVARNVFNIFAFYVDSLIALINLLF